MTIDLEEYQGLKKKVDKAKADADKAQGALERALAELKSEHGCDDLPEAEKLLKTLEKEEAAAEKDYELAMKTFRADWDEYLNVEPDDETENQSD